MRIIKLILEALLRIIGERPEDRWEHQCDNAHVQPCRACLGDAEYWRQIEADQCPKSTRAKEVRNETR